MKNLWSVWAVAMIWPALSVSVSAEPISSHCSTVTPTISERIASKLLASESLARGEFENTADYSKRMHTLSEKLGVIRVVQPFRRGDLRYDPDAQAIIVEPDRIGAQFEMLEKFIMLPDYAEREWFGVMVGGRINHSSSYRAANTYGRKFSVQKIDRTQLQVIFEGAKTRTQQNPTLSIVMSPYAAKNTMARLKIIIAGELTEPFVVSDSSYHRPDIYDRVDVNTNLLGLVVRPICGTIIDASNGSVLAEFAPESLSRWPRIPGY